MTHDFLDRYSALDGPLQRLSAGRKLLLTAVLLLGVILTPVPAQPAVYVGLAALLLILAGLSRVPARVLLGRLLLLELPALGVALLSLLRPDGPDVFARLAARSALCLSTVILLSATTPFAEILRVLRRIRTPGILVTVLALLYRYLFVLVDEAGRMDRARAGRTFSRGKAGLWRARAGVLGHLFVRSTLRAERIYAAMCARGWKP